MSFPLKELALDAIASGASLVSARRGLRARQNNGACPAACVSGAPFAGGRFLAKVHRQSSTKPGCPIVSLTSASLHCYFPWAEE
jgi:hypothetical protein